MKSCRCSVSADAQQWPCCSLNPAVLRYLQSVSCSVVFLWIAVFLQYVIFLPYVPRLLKIFWSHPAAPLSVRCVTYVCV